MSSRTVLPFAIEGKRFSGRLKPGGWRFIAGQCVSNTPARYPFPLELFSTYTASTVTVWWSVCYSLVNYTVNTLHPHPLKRSHVSRTARAICLALAHAGKVPRLSGMWLFRPGPPQQIGARFQQIIPGLLLCFFFFFSSEGTLIGFPLAWRKRGLEANLPVSVLSASPSLVLHPMPALTGESGLHPGYSSQSHRTELPTSVNIT